MRTGDPARHVIMMFNAYDAMIPDVDHLTNSNGISQHHSQLDSIWTAFRQPLILFLLLFICVSWIFSKRA
jgi:hypothetical protein